ncbi:hypothetical protein GCM10023094_48150 [Rhodococcus olei]|uniref:Band 7 domain-containing protein n=1 Tax=Rhodococcus olei TaxID=2161675 RepID=A0ABP8PJ42_9NOCA
MTAIVAAAVAAVVGAVLLSAESIRVVNQCEQGVHFRLSRIIAVHNPGLVLIIPVVDRLTAVSMRIVPMPIRSRGVVTRDDISVDVAAVAYYRVVDARKAVVTIENGDVAINQLAKTALRNVVGQHSLGEALANPAAISWAIRQILDTSTPEWGVEVTLVELEDVQTPDTSEARDGPRTGGWGSPVRQRPSETRGQGAEKRATIIAAECDARAAAPNQRSSGTRSRAARSIGASG